MPESPEIDGQGSDPERELRERFEAIEREEALRADSLANALGGLPEPDAFPEPPSNDEIRARLFASPIESQLNPDELGPEEQIGQDVERLMELDEGVRAAGSTELPEPPEWRYKRPILPGSEKRDNVGYLGIGVGISIAYTLVGATLGGWLIGWLIDRSTGGTLGQAIGTLVGAVVGLVGAVFTIVRAQSKQQ